jgi:hypothetical protein
VFDLHQAANGTYLFGQHFHHFGPLPGLSQLLSEETLARVLNASDSFPMPPLDTVTNNLVSPLFMGLQSTSVSGTQGLVSLKGVRLDKNLPGPWTLQCGVDGVMMDSPVFSYAFHARAIGSFKLTSKQVTLIDEFPSQTKRPARLNVVKFPLGCSSPLTIPPTPCPWQLYTRRIPSSVSSAEVQVRLNFYVCRVIQQNIIALHAGHR